MFELDFTKHYPILIKDDNILCNIRKRIIKITPEENIRQALVSFLISEKGYPKDKIQIEVPMSRFKPGAAGRADILIYDDDDNVLCLIECKEPNEIYTDKVLEQLLRYDEIVEAETFCILIGTSCVFMFTNEAQELLTASEFPSYKTLIEYGQIDYFLPEEIPFERFSYIEPIEEDIQNLFYDEGIFGNTTHKSYLPFLINLYNFYMDDTERATLENTEDVGLKTIKYGNAGSGVFAGMYRSFLYKQESLVSFSISSMTRDENSAIHTSLMFGVEKLGHYHLSLELRVDKHVKLTNEFAYIYHDGTITVGKLGAAKRQDLIDFINERKPELILDGKVFLGKFNIHKDITANTKDTNDFLTRSIQYALIRDEFRLYKKQLLKTHT